MRGREWGRGTPMLIPIDWLMAWLMAKAIRWFRWRTGERGWFSAAARPISKPSVWN